jgi:hypothetical protein
MRAFSRWKRLSILATPAAAFAIAMGFYLLRSEPEKRPWKTTDVWYHTSDVASLGSTGRPQLVEFFHPD